MSRYFYIALMALVSLSFTLEKSPYGKFQKWYSDHHTSFTIQKDASAYTLRLRYLPKEVKIAKQIGEKKISRKQIKQLYKDHENLHEFSFTLSSKQVKDLLMSISENEKDYSDKQFYLQDQMASHFTLRTKKGALSPLRCSFENNYGMAPVIRFHLVFETDQELQSLEFNDPLFGLNHQRFDLDKIQQLEIPKIK